MGCPLSPLEYVAAPQGAVTVSRAAALRLAWGLAFCDRPWEGGARELPTLPGNVVELYDIPRAVTVLAGDRFDASPEERDHWRPNVEIVEGSFVWRPLEMDRSAVVASGRTLGAREILIELHSDDTATVSWHSGSESPSRFIGRALAAVMSPLDLEQQVGIVVLRPVDESLPWPVPRAVGGAS